MTQIPGTAAHIRRPSALSLAGAAALLLFTCFPAGAFRLDHRPPLSAEQGKSLRVDVGLVGGVAEEDVATADVVILSWPAPVELPMSVLGGVLSCEIPGRIVEPPSVDYYIRLVDAEGVETTIPSGAPAGGVFRVAVKPSGGVEVIAPSPGTVVDSKHPEIAAIIDPPLNAPWEAVLLLDGVDVSALSDITSDLFVFVPDEPISEGEHVVEFAALDATGRVEFSWSFLVGTTPESLLEQDWLAALSQTAPGGWAPGLDVAGRLEVGWSVVRAETTASESLDVLLPYDEVSRPTLDFYAGGYGESGSFTLTAQYDPVFYDELSWSLSAGNRTFELQAGEVFPSLSGTTLDWVVGEGGAVTAHLGSSTTELVGMRMNEADTLGGFGIYSRFALGAKETFEWSEGSSASLVYMRAFDREGSVEEGSGLSEPLRSDVVAGLLSLERGRGLARLELARSSADGPEEGDGAAGRLLLRYGPDRDAHVSLEYITSEPSFYSAGSYEYDPGESVLRSEFSLRPTASVRTSGYVGMHRTSSSDSGKDPDEWEFRAYGRADLIPGDGGRGARSYFFLRYDSVPYETSDYSYFGASAGVSWRGTRMRLGGNASWSRTLSDEETKSWSAGADVRFDLVPGTWEARLGGRLLASRSDTGETDYRRVRWTSELVWSGSDTDVRLNYQLLDMDDTASPDESYTEHVLRVGVGRAF